MHIAEDDEAGSVIQTFTIPSSLDHFKNDEEGQLRRQAISMAINRDQLIDKVFASRGARQEEEAKKRGEAVKPAEKVAEPQPVYKVRTTKNVSIKTVAKTASWRLESKDDVDKYLAALRENLLKEMDEDTIVNIEL
jgi:ABC-type oligopeptide transport system substrate-binding subunit